jgi:hypothetical protein
MGGSVGIMRIGPRLAGLVVMMSLVLAATAYGQAPTQDSVTGGAMVIPRPGALVVQIDAHSGPAGENPTGRVSLDCVDCGGRSHDHGGTVSCLNVQGNRAVIGVYGDLLINGGGGSNARFLSLVEVVDNGSPGVGRDTVTVQSSG